ncbi:MAG: LPS assembly lipoprotein LptE [Bacteroidetes bacterium]|nr:LPS assembly lipoprotein LptE [Bacteroidota bacterium]
MVKIIIHFFLIITLYGCYSFRGGTIPEHLKTLQIASVIDNSNFGNPEYKIDLETEITNNFIKDKSFDLSDEDSDAKLSVSITSIVEAVNSVGQGELEQERRITLSCSVEYYDNVNKKQIWKKNFSSYGLFDINQAFTARDETIKVVIKQIAEDILLAIVSDW